MNSLPPPDRQRAQHVPYTLPAQRVDAMWQRLAEAETARAEGGLQRLAGWFKPSPALGLAVAAAVVLMIAAGQPSDPPSAWSGARLQTGEEAVKVALSDGSEIEAAPHAALELMHGSEHEVRLSLHRGAGDFKVAKNKDRDFVVQAGPVAVRVVGTQFRVTRDINTQQVEVQVREGIVEVEAFGEVRRLLAGETLRLPSTPPEPTASDAELPEEVTEAPETRRPRPARRAKRAEPALPKEGAKDVLEAAQAALARGDRKHAAALYESLVERFPADPRAPLASFELARVRMDHLRNPKGAIRALHRALRSDHQPFRQDAMARLVHAAEASGDGRCGEFQAAYLKAYPAGRYAEDVRLRCNAAPHVGAQP